MGSQQVKHGNELDKSNLSSATNLRIDSDVDKIRVPNPECLYYFDNRNEV